MAKKLYEESNIQAIANAIRSKNGTTNTYKTNEMASAIEAIQVGSGGGGELPESAFLVDGNCSYRFNCGGWDWFIDNYGHLVTCENITKANYMFQESKVERIPFTITFKNLADMEVSYMFYNCTNLKELPRMSNCSIGNCGSMFYGCQRLATIPDDFETWFRWEGMENATSTYSCQMAQMFVQCSSLRKIPVEIFHHANKNLSYSASYLYGGFKLCHVLDEITNLPLPYTSEWTSNAFYDTFSKCGRVKAVTFETPDGQPRVMKWKSQIIDLSTCGHASLNSDVTNYNSGITMDTKVTDDATYNALKNNPDWWTTSIYYSRYNHDSAVQTLNSLPDTSAYLASKGGTNTIKLKGRGGEDTDGGAINTLTEEEIAVATAKGWTVTFVS